MVRQVSDVLPQVPDHAIQEDLSNYRGQVLLVTVECRQASVHIYGIKNTRCAQNIAI